MPLTRPVHVLRSLGLTLAAGLVLSELLLRFGLGLGNPVIVAPDAACDYIVKPDQNTTRFFHKIHINHFGMRSADVADTRDPQTIRILFLGDSITFGTSRVNQQSLFTEIVHRELPPHLHRSVEVLNVSAGAWAIDNELSYVQSRGIFHASLVALVINSGDLTQPRSTMSQVGDDLPRSRPLFAWGEVYQRYLKPRLFERGRRIDAGDKAEPSNQSVVQANLKDLDRLNTLVTAQGAQLAVIYIPFRKDIPELSDAALRPLSAWATKDHVPLLDLTLVEAQHSAAQITLDNGIHLNTEGHALVAKPIQSFLSGVLHSS